MKRKVETIEKGLENIKKLYRYKEKNVTGCSQLSNLAVDLIQSVSVSQTCSHIITTVFLDSRPNLSTKSNKTLVHDDLRIPALLQECVASGLEIQTVWHRGQPVRGGSYKDVTRTGKPRFRSG